MTDSTDDVAWGWPDDEGPDPIEILQKQVVALKERVEKLEKKPCHCQCDKCV